MYYAEDIVREIEKSSQIVMFGAGIIAHNTVNCLVRSPYQWKIEYCIVSDKESNPKDVMGIPVIDLRTAEREVRKDAAVLVASLDKNFTSIQELLHSCGFINIYSIAFDSDLWERLRGNYFREYRLSCGQAYLTLEEELERIPSLMEEEETPAPVHIYMVRSHVDKNVEEDIRRFAWEIPIQAGAALTTERICEVCDNAGDHISNKNREYCELTALYWIWKNDDSAAYAGLCHYRRHFELEEEMLRKLSVSDIDVLLTIPILNFPSVRAIYENDHIIADWDIMLEALEILAPDYVDAARVLQSGQHYSGYNMFVARKEILDAYCEWLFPILAYCEQHCGKKVDVYQNRYIGFLAERLLSIYFARHEKEYKIVYARKHFIER